MHTRTNYGHTYFEAVPQERGLNQLKHNTCRIIDFQFLKLAAGETHSFDTADREYGLDIFTGVADIHVDETLFKHLGGRKSVFDGPPTGVYAGCGTSVTIVATTDLEIGLGSAPSTTPITPYCISPEDSDTGQWGSGNNERHYRYLINGARPSERLWLAEVFVQDGCWATYPPHKHEDVEGDLFQEEMYFYKVEPEHGFGFCAEFEGQVGGDYAFMIRDNTIHKMPHGYHTVAAAPGFRVFYLAIYAGRTKEHRPSPHPLLADFQQNPMPRENLR